jgi:hypothetical protein
LAKSDLFSSRFKIMANRISVSLCTAAAFFSIACSSSQASILLNASSFAVLSGSTATNTGNTTLNGNLGIFPGTAITGSVPITFINPSGVHDTDALALQAKMDEAAAYVSLELLPFTMDLSGQNLGLLTLVPGVYRFGTSAQIDGNLTLDAQNNPNALFVFQVGSALNETVGSTVRVVNGNAGTGVFWRVGSSATLNTNAIFAGNILADQSITLNTGAAILCGRALTQNGAVTLDTNVISNSCSFNNGTGRTDFGSLGFSGQSQSQSVPEPGSALLLAAGSLALVGKWWFDRQRRSSPC